MGANFDCNIIKDEELKMSNEEIEKAAGDIFDDSAYQNGHGGYSGTLAEKIGEGVKIQKM